jgi:Subtilase family
MEWAARRARVVSMSLGGDPTDGTDPMSQAVNKLSRDTGALFVLAAGNSGPDAGTVGAPGAADAALTVGSVSKQDAISEFSARGPRVGRNGVYFDGAVKPDLTAPGQDIAAARAAGTDMGGATPVNEHYIKASGTSMATPHVAGAAAILAQAHPDWKADRLKHALTCAGRPAAGLGEYAQGTGRVDVARALRQKVHATGGSPHFFVSWPFAAKQPVGKPVGYRNDSAAAVTLNLALTAAGADGKPAPPGLFRADRASVTLPPGATATVRLTLDPRRLPAAGGVFSGRIAATAADGTAVQAVFGAYAEPRMHTVTATMTDRLGKPASAGHASGFAVVDLSGSGSWVDGTLDANGAGKVRVPPGRYAVHAYTVTPLPGPDPEAVESATWASSPSLTLDRDVSVAFDARRARKIDVTVDRPGTVLRALQVDMVVPGAQFSADSPGWPQYAEPVRAARPGDLSFGVQAVRGPADARTGDWYYLALPTVGAIPADLAYQVRTADLAQVRTRLHAEGRDAAGELTRTAHHYLPGQVVSSEEYRRTHAPVRLPSTVTHYVSPGPVQWSDWLYHFAPGGSGPPQDWERHLSLQPRSYPKGVLNSQVWNRAVFGPELQSPQPHARYLRSSVSRRGDVLSVAVNLRAPGEPGRTTVFDDSAMNHLAGTTVLSRDGKVLGSSKFPGTSGPAGFGLPAGAGRYTLAVTAQRTTPWTELSRRVEATWTFASTPSDPAGPPVPQPLLTVRTTGNLDLYNRARAGRAFGLVLAVRHQSGAPAPAVRKVGLEVSYDDGRTWAAVGVTRAGAASWRAGVAHPPVAATNGFVALRTSAGDAAGNTVRQTVTRAYKLVG